MTLIACANGDAIEWSYGDFLDGLPILPETRSRKAFKAFIEANQDTKCLIDPSVQYFGKPGEPRAFSPREAYARWLENSNKDLIITNHPRRSWFGTLALAKDGETITFKEK